MIHCSLSIVVGNQGQVGPWNRVSSVQGSAKEWSLGCVKRASVARGGQDAGITQPRDHCFSRSLYSAILLYGCHTIIIPHRSSMKSANIFSSDAALWIAEILANCCVSKTEWDVGSREQERGGCIFGGSRSQIFCSCRRCHRRRCIMALNLLRCTHTAISWRLLSRYKNISRMKSIVNKTSLFFNNYL